MSRGQEEGASVSMMKQSSMTGEVAPRVKGVPADCTVGKVVI